MRLFKRRLKNALSSTTATLKIIKRKIVQNGSFQTFFKNLIFLVKMIRAGFLKFFRNELRDRFFENFGFSWELILKQTNSQDDKSWEILNDKAIKNRAS